MRSFTQILSESKKLYSFKIGVAGELPEGFADKLESALQKFGVSSLTSGKTTPIQERPLDFPQLQNMEVSYFDTEMTYPTTSQVLRGYLSSICSISEANIVVRNSNEPLDRYQQDMPANESDVEAYETLLDTTEMKSTSAQHDVGSNRVMELLKELEQARKEREHDPAAAAPVGTSEDISDKVNTKSPIGS
jgi:hypothetical protein